ncbi:MAG: acyl-CoA mutase large subunit family protein [Rikenellaceae bacterium]|jgi:methylmalonyl-CoA mutase|nr:acyl-CoA mutase large subunit family protein [Rikenellaceae bacterium]
MATNNEKLFSEFPPVATGAWEEVINADLKGADYEKKLVWKTAEGFSVRPYYRAESLEGIAFLDTRPGQFPYVRGTKANNNWQVRQTVDVADPKAANARALDVLMRGADSLSFRISEGRSWTAADLDALLKDIEIKAISLNFTGCGVAHVAGLVIEKVKNEKLDPEDVHVSFDIDPLVGKLSLKGKTGSCCEGGTCFDKIKSLIEAAGPYKRMRLVTVNGKTFHNCGSTIVQELAFSLAVGHEYVVRGMEAGLTVDRIAPSLLFNFAISSNYFMEIAKFRAARMLWANVMAPYNPARGCSSKMKIHATTSMWNMTVYDPCVNMLRGTTEAMSAALAGVDSLEVLPFDAAYAAPGEFSTRIARNTQLLLKEESHFNQVADPAGGSYYIENLTRSIADEAWKLFLQVEEQGGYTKAFETGFIQARVKASADARDKAVSTRREILLGTNQYPNFTETADAAVTADATASTCSCGCSDGQNPMVLHPYRGSMAFERMRLAVDRSGKEPAAFMLTVGALAFARARAQFASNFFGCAGIRPIDNVRFGSVEEGVKTALESKAPIVVLCSSDDEYAAFAPEAKKLLGDKAILVIAGDPACRPELEAAGITRFVSVRSNVLETLKGYQKELGI